MVWEANNPPLCVTQLSPCGPLGITWIQTSDNLWQNQGFVQPKAPIVEIVA